MFFFSSILPKNFSSLSQAVKKFNFWKVHFGKPPTWLSQNLSSFIFSGISRSFLPQLTVKKTWGHYMWPISSMDQSLNYIGLTGIGLKQNPIERKIKRIEKKCLIWGKRALPKERWPMECLRSEILFSLILVLTETLIFHKKTILSEYQAHFLLKI